MLPDTHLDRHQENAEERNPLGRLGTRLRGAPICQTLVHEGLVNKARVGQRSRSNDHPEWRTKQAHKALRSIPTVRSGYIACVLAGFILKPRG